MSKPCELILSARSYWQNISMRISERKFWMHLSSFASTVCASFCPHQTPEYYTFVCPWLSEEAAWWPPFRVTAWLRLGGTAGGHLVQVPVAQEHVQDHVRESHSPAQYQFPTVWGTILNGLPVLPCFCVTIGSFRLKHVDSAKLLRHFAG